MLPLRTVARLAGPTQALLDGAVETPGLELEFVDVPVLVHAFRRMVRDLEFDVCELALTTYLCAREHRVPITALPVFLVRRFHHGATLVAADGSVSEPRDIEGRRVGVNRGWTVTTGVWARGVLETQYGVDLEAVTWVRSGDEHVAGYEPPTNVVDAEAGLDLADAVRSDDLAAGVNLKPGDGLVPLVPQPQEAALDALSRSGHYPINHVVVVRDDVLAERPEVAQQLLEAFTASKDHYVDRLRGGDAPADLHAGDDIYGRVLDVTGEDPLPYGVEPNRGPLEELVGHAVRQSILRRPPADVAEMFAPVADAPRR